MTHDFDGDGIIDQWGIGADSVTILCTAMLRSNLAAMVDRTVEGQYVYNLQDAKALKALQFTSDLVHTYKVTANANLRNNFINGTMPMYIGTSVSAASYYKFGTTGPTNFGFEILPSGPDNTGDYYMREQSSHMWFFPRNISEPEAAINAFAWWQVAWDESKSDYLTFDDMNKSSAQIWLGAAKDGEMEVNRYMDAVHSSTIVYDYIEYFGSVKTLMTNNVFNLVGKERISPVSNIEAIKLQSQEIIDVIMGR